MHKADCIFLSETTITIEHLLNLKEEFYRILLSFPSRGTGIETFQELLSLFNSSSFPSRGTGIETPAPPHCHTDTPRRSPHGERGLKRAIDKTENAAAQSFPSRGTGIETMHGCTLQGDLPHRLPWGRRGLKETRDQRLNNLMKRAIEQTPLDGPFHSYEPLNKCCTNLQTVI